MEIELSEQQEAAIQVLLAWLEKFPNVPRSHFVLEGFAGTGKTTMIRQAIARTGRLPSYRAYTGKAAMVMQKAGVPASTIHSKIYKLKTVSDDTFRQLYKARDEAEGDEQKKIVAKIKELMKPRFELNEKAFREEEDEALEDFDDDTNEAPKQLLVLDECSMVNDDMLRDLKSFKLPIVALGDPGQLPPVDGTGALFKGLADARLTEIRRQALDNPIIAWSMKARQKIALPYTNKDMCLEDKAAKVNKSMFAGAEFAALADSHDIIIAWKNITRMQMNQWKRRLNGNFMKDGVYPVKGERLLITKNDREHGLFNGMFAEVVSDPKLMDVTIDMVIVPEGSNREVEVKILRACFEQYQNPDAFEGLRKWDYSGTQQADFGYCLTCHKAQGSQWDRVMVLDEPVLAWPKAAEDRAKWLYTAVTRAVEKVTIVVGK